MGVGQGDTCTPVADSCQCIDSEGNSLSVDSFHILDDDR